MFDTSFNNSKTYFTLLQLLRVFKDSMQRTADELESYAKIQH
jgi:hypothetical protein